MFDAKWLTSETQNDYQERNSFISQSHLPQPTTAVTINQFKQKLKQSHKR